MAICTVRAWDGTTPAMAAPCGQPATHYLAPSGRWEMPTTILCAQHAPAWPTARKITKYGRDYGVS